MVDQLKDISQDPGATLFPTQEGEPPSKSGWADTFQWIAQQLGLDTTHPNGARKFTGHSARATGAVHLAMTQVELWRVQLFGRWGSKVFMHYVRDAPICQLDKLALETSVHISLNSAKAQLEALLRRTSEEKQMKIACPTAQMLQDCEASMVDIAPPKPTDVSIQNLNGNKIHRSLVYSEEIHPREWKTRCGWHFGGAHTAFSTIDTPKTGQFCCRNCFPEFAQATKKSSGSSSSSSQSSSSSS